MGKRFINFKLSRIIPSFLSCRSKHPASLPFNPLPSFLRPSPSTAISKLRRPPPLSPPSTIPTSKRRRSSLKSHVSSALLSFRRSFLGSPSPREDFHTQSSSPFQWDKDPNWHVIAKIPDYNYHTTPPRHKIYTSAASESDNDVVLFPPLPLNNRRRRRSRRRRRNFQRIRLSTSSDSGQIFSDDEGDGGDDMEMETDTLVSTDDSATIPRRRRSGAAKRRASVEETARLSDFMRRVVGPCKGVEGKVRESFAVVKNSADPYEDFKRSMAEMVVAKQMLEAVELEELLRCFLSLNSDRHHEVIVRAFTDVWEALFCQPFS